MKWIVVIIVEIVYFLMGIFLCDINPSETYTWFSGIWHGFFFPIRWIMSFFNDDFLYKAVRSTTGYDIFYVIFTIISIVICIVWSGIKIIAMKEDN